MASDRIVRIVVCKRAGSLIKTATIQTAKQLMRPLRRAR